MKNELGFIPEIDAFYFKSGLILGNEFKVKRMSPEHMLNVLEHGFNLDNYIPKNAKNREFLVKPYSFYESQGLLKGKHLISKKSLSSDRIDRVLAPYKADIEEI